MLQVYSPFEAGCFVPARMAPELVGSVGFLSSRQIMRDAELAWVEIATDTRAFNFHYTCQLSTKDLTASALRI
jgi:hypothetical protein